MAGWVDADEVESEVSKAISAPDDVAFRKPRQIDEANILQDTDHTRGFDVDDSFDQGRNENEKENGYPVRGGPRSSAGRRSLPPPSTAPPPRGAPVMSEGMMAKVREKSALRVSMEKEKSSHSVAGDEKGRDRGDKEVDWGEHTDDDLEELRKEEEDNDIVRHPSVNMSEFRTSSPSDDGKGYDSDDGVEGSDIDEETDERILGERSGVDRMPGSKSEEPTRDNRIPFSLVAHESGEGTARVQCTVLRDRYGSRLFPEYQLILDDTKKAILLARKQSMNSTSNYHIFDMTRGAAGKKMSKKSGNYLGKLRASAMDSSDYVLLTRNSERAEVAAVSYERSTMLKQLKDGSQPRRLFVVVPRLDAESVPVPNIVAEGGGSGNLSIAAHVRDPVECQQRQLYSLTSKEPTYENGNYRLNFYGRVSHPSVKNFQIVNVDNPDDIICQFGKVGEDKFHLDFKAPISPFQAFGIALTQFNI